MYKVLLVDDEPLITKGLKALINWEDYGYEVVSTAEDGVEAISYIENNHIDLLITDIMMPNMSGLELIEKTNQVKPSIKHIILSGYQEFDYVKQGLELGIENYLLKPIDEKELLNTISAVRQKLNVSVGFSNPAQFTTLKDNTLWRLLNGEINKSDYEERLSLYGMNLESKYYSVAILHFENSSSLEQSNRLRSFIEDNFQATCLFNPNHELIIIFDNEQKSLLLDQVKSLEKTLNNMINEIGSFYLTLGKIISTMDNLEESYHVTRELSLFQICLKPNKLIKEETDVNKRELLDHYEQLKDMVTKSIMQSEQDVDKGIEQFFEELVINQMYASPITIRKYTIDLIFHIHHSLQIDQYYNHGIYAEKMTNTTSLPQIKELLKKYCYDLIDTIKNRDQTRSPIIQNVLEFIHINYDQELSLKTLSQRFYVNQIYLGQLFQKEVGIVFSEYVNHYRLEKAKELLKETHLGAGEIGKKVGYSDTTYFYKQFKKSVGMTPTEWRNL